MTRTELIAALEGAPGPTAELFYDAGKEQVETHGRRIGENLPKAGKVTILSFTDKQYENMVCFVGKKREPDPKTPQQFTLF